MAQPQAKTPMTPEEYLAFEAASPVKHEYVRGEIFAMAGTTKSHNRVAFNMTARLEAAIKGGPCRAYMAEVKVRVEAADAFYYPDVHVTCDPRDHEDPLISRHPSVIVEVLSESTAAYDRGEKFADYRQLPSLREYVLVDSRVQRVEIFRRQEHDWQFIPLESADTLTVDTLGCAIAVSDIYSDTDVPVHLPPSSETRDHGQ